MDGATCRIGLPSGPTEFRSTGVKPLNRPHPEKPENEIGEQDEEQERNNKNENENDLPRRNPGRTTRSQPNLADITVFIGEYDSNTPKRGKHVNTATQCGVLQKNDNKNGNNENLPTRKPPSFAESRKKEINGLYEKGAFEFIDASKVPEGARIFGSRFVDEIKHPGTDKAYEKSHLVIQAYNDPGKDLILTQSPTVQRVSQRLILVLAVTFVDRNKKPLSLYLRDISQAYVQSQTPLARDFFAQPPPELGLPPNTILKLLRPLYGVPEAGNHWFQTYHKYHREQLEMEQSTYDPCLLFTTGQNLGVIGLQTDDTLLLADEDFAEKEEKKLRKAGFMTKDREKLTSSSPIKFNGGSITSKGNSLTLTQEQHCQNLKTVSPEAINLTSSRGVTRKMVLPKEQYIAQRARGAYIATVCQPEAAYDLSSAAQVTEPTEEDVKKLNKRLMWQSDNSSRGLDFIPLKAPFKLVVFTDSSFANNSDYSSQIGYIIVLADKDNKANILHWSSTKCKRVTRSTLASELYGMANGFDVGAAIKGTIEKVMKLESLPLILCTDSKSLYECLVKLGTTHEKRLMVDIMCLRQSYE